MHYRKLFQETSRLRTKDLLVEKMVCTTRMSFFKSLKNGFLGLLGLFVAHLAKAIFAQQDLSWVGYLSVILAMNSVCGYLICDALEANLTARKELICDLLALRMSRARKKKS